MIKDVTDEAVTQLLALAEEAGMDSDRVYFLIEGKLRNPPVLIWFITPALSYGAGFIPRDLKGLKFAVEEKGAIFLTNVVIDYKAGLLKSSKVYAPTNTQLDKPVWPKGFVFEDQILQNTYT